MQNVRPASPTNSALGRFLAAGGLLVVTSFLILLAGSGCTAGGMAEDATVETLASGAIRITHNTLPDHRRSLDTLAVWDLWDEGGDYIFSRIADAAGTDDGFFLLDTGNFEVVRVDLAGRMQEYFGRKGQGPGEFSFPFHLFATPDEIWVADPGNYRLSVFGTTGSYRKDIRWGEYRWFDGGFNVLPDGRVLSAVQITGDFENPDTQVAYHSIILDLAEERADTLATMVGLQSERIEVRSAGGQGITFFGPPQFAPRLHWALSPSSRVIIVSGSDYQIDERDFSGSVTREIVAPAPDLTVTQSDRDWFFEEEGMQFGFGSGEVFTATRESLQEYPFADRRQAVSGLQVDPAGRIWVEAATEDPGRHRLDLFDSEGHYLGHLGDTPMPMAFTTDGHALLRLRHEDGIDLFYVVSIAETEQGL
jgi:hypothetical protein